MAINVNTVYQTVLLILNKEQRGYLTPVEFNKIGAQVQLEIFEAYFDSLNQQIRVPQTNTDYANRVANLDEKIQIFKTTGAATYANGIFNLPTNQGAVASLWSITSTGAQNYPITTITASNLENAVVTVSVNGIVRPQTDYSITSNSLIWNANTPRGTVTNTVGTTIAPPVQTITTTTAVAQPNITVGSYITGDTITASTGNPANTVTITSNGVGGVGINQQFITDTAQTLTATDAITFFSTITVTAIPNNFYRLGTVLYTSGSRLQELERVDRSGFYTMNLSPLTKPSKSFPVYLYENNQLTVYPTSIQNGITVDYIRKPANPSWNFDSNAANNYSYIYNANTSTNFELHPADQTEVILKTLLYAGVVIEDPTIIQVAAQQVEKENINQQR
jgi:hypothetical protein|tara:strand:+ start:859 stop:2034 length:1176 start_codon:yes stop_codon:yes gene_type:complete